MGLSDMKDQTFGVKLSRGDSPFVYGRSVAPLSHPSHTNSLTPGFQAIGRIDMEHGGKSRFVKKKSGILRKETEIIFK